MDRPDTQVDLTILLLQWRDGSKEALEQIFPVVYAELRKMAQNYMRKESAGHTMQATELVHESYMRLIGSQDLEFQNRAHFFAIAARAMRQVLVEHARSRSALKRGGGGRPLPLEEGLQVGTQSPDVVVALDGALKELAAFDQRKSQIVEMRYFGGLTTEQIGAVLGISDATIRRDLKLAHAWLKRETS